MNHQPTTTSFLEQCTVLKEGAALVLANHSNGFHWGRIILNYLLIQTLGNQKYRRVIIICEDVKISEIQILLSMSQSNNLSRVLFVASWKDFIDSYFVTSPPHSFNHDDSIAIFLYSLGGLLYQEVNTMFSREFQLLLRLTAQSKDTGRDKSAGVSCSWKDCSILFITNLEMPLLASSQLHYVKSLFSTVVTAIPNSGTLSEEVVLQVQTIRRSTSTGKIQENVEMFSFKKPGVLLAPITVSSSSNHSYRTMKTESEKPEKILFEADRANQSIITPPTTTSQPSTTSTTNAVHPRLITFDSADPEFDEDSDPDADLDL